MLPINSPGLVQLPLNNLTLVPKFVDVLDTLDEEKIIHYLNTYGIDATSEKFPEDGYSKRLIHIAATKGWAKLIQNLIVSGEQFDVGADAQDGTFDPNATPFAFAALSGHFDTMALLLEQGASFNQHLPDVINQQFNLSIKMALDAQENNEEFNEASKITVGEFILLNYITNPEKWRVELLLRYHPKIFLNALPKIINELFLAIDRKIVTESSSLLATNVKVKKTSQINFGMLIALSADKFSEKHQFEFLQHLANAQFPINSKILKKVVVSSPIFFQKLFCLIAENLTPKDKNYLLSFSFVLIEPIISGLSELILSKFADDNVKFLEVNNSGQNCYELSLIFKKDKMTNLAKKILEMGDGFGEVLISQKLLLLRYGTKVSVPVENRTITFEGYNNWITYPEVFNSITSFFKAKLTTINQQSIDSILETYWQHVHGTDQKGIWEAISLEKQVIIDSGWKGNEEEIAHAVTVLIYKNRICVANRGAGALEGEEGLIFYEMDEQVKRLEIIDLLMTNTPETKAFLCNLKNQPGFTKVLSLKHKRQPVGNCTWVSPKTITRACFLNVFLDQGKELKEAIALSRTLYNEWITFDKIYGLNRFLNDPYHKKSKKQNENEGIIFDRVVQECLLHAPKGLKEVLFKQLLEYSDPLQQVLFLNDTQKALKIIENADFSFQHKSKTSLSPLHLAAYLGQPEIIRALLKKEICHLSVNKIKPSPVEIAFEKNHFEIVKQLLPFYTEIDALNDQKKSLLSLSCKLLAVDIIKLLIELNADCNIPDDQGMIPFYDLCMQQINAENEAIEKRRAACLLQFPKINLKMTSKDGWGILHYAVFSKDIKIVEFVLNAMKEKKCDLDLVSLGGNTPLLLALNAEVPSGEIIKMLIDGGCNVNAITPSKTSALSVALNKGLGNIVELLLDKGADFPTVEKDEWSSLHNAIYTNDQSLKAVIKAMKHRGIDLNPIIPGGYTPLLTAIDYNGSFSSIKILIESGVDLNVQTSLKRSALSCAVIKNREDVVQLLLDNDVDLTSMDEFGWTAFDYACYFENLNIMMAINKAVNKLML